MPRTSWNAVVVLALMVSTAHAQEVKHAEPVVVTATRTETPAEQLGASVTVITGEEIDTRRYPTVDEALRGVPGVDIRRSGGFGKTTAISIRGANPNQVQVLVDGMRVKSPTLGQVDLSDLSPDLIDRIEQSDRVPGPGCRLAHLRVRLVEPHDSRAYGRQMRGRHRERFAVQRVEPLRDVAGEFQMLGLVIAHRHDSRLI